MNIIHVFGAAGSGTTTIARAIHNRFGHVHLDTDNYFWVPTDPPYIIKRSPLERQQLLKVDIAKHERCVISGSLCGRGDCWGDIFIPLFDLAIFVDAPTDVRIKRIQEREYEEFGDRILPGGDMYENHSDFISWARSYDTGGINQRSRALHLKWMENLTCPILMVDGTKQVIDVLSTIEKMLII